MRHRTQQLLAFPVLCSILVLLAGCSVGSLPGESVGEQEIEYFVTVALGVEFGSSEATIKKWTRNLRIEVSGDPTDEDKATLDQVVAELNALQDRVRLELVEGMANVEMTFAPEAEFSKLET
ncbi:MAG: DUF2927 domain-containing protein [Anaerolineae bacterium]|jgi:hypothetical protein